MPVAHEADLCIVGGSCTGVFAAVRAARLGLRVAIVERHNCFGGVATAAAVNIWHSLHDTVGEREIIGGMTLEDGRLTAVVIENKDIPYRSLVQDRVPNLVLAGRMLDTDKVAFSAVRVMVNMNQTGEATGVACALALGDSVVVFGWETSCRATLLPEEFGNRHGLYQSLVLETATSTLRLTLRSAQGLD